MKYHFLLIFSLLMSLALCLHAQNALTMKDYFMYTNVAVSHNGTTHNVQALIDTGASVCAIDSTFAADSCHIISTESNAAIGYASGKIKSFVLNLDRISVGGLVYPETRCYVIDLAGKFQEHAPKFILGGSILKRELWCFDLKKNILTHIKEPLPKIQSVIKWKNHENHKDAVLNFIYLNGKIVGKKTRIHLDTGSKHNYLPLDFGVTATKEIESMRGDIAHKITIRKVGLAENVSVEIGQDKFLLDFVLDERGEPRINASFLWGKTFVLDYKKKRIFILKIPLKNK